MGLISFTLNNGNEHYYQGKNCDIKFSQGGTNGRPGGGPILLELMFVHDNNLFEWWLQKSEAAGTISINDDRYGYNRTVEFQKGFCTDYREVHAIEGKGEARDSGPGLISITIEAKTFTVQGAEFENEFGG